MKNLLFYSLLFFLLTSCSFVIKKVNRIKPNLTFSSEKEGIKYAEKFHDKTDNIIFINSSDHIDSNCIKEKFKATNGSDGVIVLQDGAYYSLNQKTQACFPVTEKIFSSRIILDKNIFVKQDNSELSC